MTLVWQITVRPDPKIPDFGQGFALAETEAEAIALSGCPHTEAIRLPNIIWPSSSGVRFVWTRTPQPVGGNS